MEGRSLIYRYLKGHTYPPSRVNTQASVEIWISSVHVSPSGLLSHRLSLSLPFCRAGWVDAYRYRCLQAFFLTVYLFPPLCFSDQNNWLQELTVFPYFLFNTVETRLPPYHFPALPHLTISHALFPQSLCYGNSGFLLLIHMCLNKYWHRSLHFPFWANN